MKQLVILFFSISSLLFISCSDDHQAAKQHLANARNFLIEQNFEKAKSEIDSINILYPKSFDERRVGMALLDSVRKAENEFIIREIDFILMDLHAEVERMKTDFLYKRDAKYQESGFFVPKLTGGAGALAYTTLHSGVEESGRLYLESIYIGGQKHNKIKVEAGGELVESLQVEGDGAIHRFSDLGKNYEIIHLTGANENGIAKFIAANADKNLKVTLIGSQATSYSLPKNIKNAIVQSYNLSTQMLLIDSLKTEREKAEFRNFYLDNGKKTAIPINDTISVEE